METKAKNVIDPLKDKSIDEIKKYCDEKRLGASVCMVNVEGDFNISTMVRNANFFGFNSVHYCGKKKWDKRGAVGTYHYTPMFFHKTEEDAYIQFKTSEKYARAIICIENNIPEFEHKTAIFTGSNNVFAGLMKPVFVFGSENQGLSDFWLTNCDTIITIQGYGSVRSLNVGTTSGIIMSAYRNYIEGLKKLLSVSV